MCYNIAHQSLGERAKTQATSNANVYFIFSARHPTVVLQRLQIVAQFSKAVWDHITKQNIPHVKPSFE